MNDKRPWYRKKTTYGIVASLIGATIVLTPGAPVVFTIITLPVTTSMIGTLLMGIGSALGSYGASKRADKIIEGK